MKNTNTKTLTRVALLVAIELVMKLVGLGSVPVGPLYRASSPCPSLWAPSPWAPPWVPCWAACSAL